VDKLIREMRRIAGLTVEENLMSDV